MITSIISKIPKWGWIVIIVVLGLLIINYISAQTLNKSLFNFALDNLRKDRTAEVEQMTKDLKEKEESIKDLQQQIVAKQKQIIAIQKQRDTAQAESQRLRGLNDEKDKQILALQKEREVIIVPTDPNVLADEFRKRGYKPRVVFPSQ